MASSYWAVWVKACKGKHTHTHTIIKAKHLKPQHKATSKKNFVGEKKNWKWNYFAWATSARFCPQLRLKSEESWCSFSWWTFVRSSYSNKKKRRGIRQLEQINVSSDRKRCWCAHWFQHFSMWSLGITGVSEQHTEETVEWNRSAEGVEPVKCVWRGRSLIMNMLESGSS